MRRLLAALLLEPFLLLRQPGGIIALVGNAAAAVELEDPAGDVVEEIAVVGDDQDRARIALEVAFEPGDGLGVEVIGRLVEQQQVGRFEQEPAQRDAPLLAARELVDFRVVGRAAQRVHRLVDLGIQVPQALRLDLVLEPRHLVGGLVRIVHGELVVAREHGALRAHPLHHVLAHAFCRVELRLLRQVPDPRALRRPGLPGKLLVEPGHDPQQRRFPGAVGPQHADLGIGIERQIDVLEHLAVARIGLGETLHVIDELAGHRPLSATMLV